MSARRRSSDRRWRHVRVDPSRTRNRTTQQLIATVVALVLLIVFWSDLSGGAAGCFMNMTGDKKGLSQSTPTPTAGEAEGSATQQAQEQPQRDELPTVRIQLPDAPKKATRKTTP